ncbi:hypothetical protein BpHYR1_014538 [Brachionus plicatilis]|uniref:Uncharacterized protein n=1 Tax=Brachionus plicatilis TaxID=10195 RepID=A0A3M7PYS1_BRAPC|nr:hypothetical protein BpHYR1_014538 [Brachionus plicatilis]
MNLIVLCFLKFFLIQYSFGQPELVYSSDDQIFTFNQEGFVLNVEFVTDLDPRPKIDNIECLLKFEDYVILGKVKATHIYPLEIFFKAPVGTAKRIALEEKIVEIKSVNSLTMLNISLQCEASVYQSKQYTEHSLTIGENQLKSLNLINDLFCDKSPVFITKKQLESLSDKLYKQLKIEENFKLSESEFGQKFIQDFTKQTAELINHLVPIDQLVNNLSCFNLPQDFKPDAIKKKLSNLFPIDLLSIDRAVLNSTFGNLSFLVDTGFLNDLELIRTKLNDFGSNFKNEINWAHKQNKIVGASVKVTKLNRLDVDSQFMKLMRFPQVIKHDNDKALKRVFYLDKFGFSKKVSKLNYLDSSIKKLKNSMQNLLVKHSLNSTDSWILENVKSLKIFKRSLVLNENSFECQNNMCFLDVFGGKNQSNFVQEIKQNRLDEDSHFMSNDYYQNFEQFYSVNSLRGHGHTSRFDINCDKNGIYVEYYDSNFNLKLDWYEIGYVDFDLNRFKELFYQEESFITNSKHLDTYFSHIFSKDKNHEIDWEI